jgi:response regulator RpfG family c-di-GMP phosphodiesterase
MITAAQAKEQTMERITMTAKEVITNEASQEIQKAINVGRFRCTVNLKGVRSPKATGAEIVSQLKALGFEAEHITCVPDPEGYIDIKWEDPK